MKNIIVKSALLIWVIAAAFKLFSSPVLLEATSTKHPEAQALEPSHTSLIQAIEKDDFTAVENALQSYSDSKTLFAAYPIVQKTQNINYVNSWMREYLKLNDPAAFSTLTDNIILSYAYTALEGDLLTAIKKKDYAHVMRLIDAQWMTSKEELAAAIELDDEYILKTILWGSIWQYPRPTTYHQDLLENAIKLGSLKVVKDLVDFETSPKGALITAVQAEKADIVSYLLTLSPSEEELAVARELAHKLQNQNILELLYYTEETSKL